MQLTIERVMEIQRQAQRKARGEVNFPYRPPSPWELDLLCNAWLELETRVKCKDAEKLVALEKQRR